MEARIKIDCNKTLDLGYAIKRMCDECVECIGCPLSNTNNCIDITQMTQKKIDAVQEWANANPERLVVGDRVCIEDLSCVYADYDEFMWKYGSERERLYWNYGRLPEIEYIFTISSINPYPNGGDTMVAIITREVDLLDRANIIEVYAVEASKLKKIK